MPADTINNINLYWEMNGSTGEPLVLVHGSWGDHHNWDGVVNELSKTFRVVTYDRRGHSLSERTNEQGSIEQDVDDLIALLEFLNITPAHIAGNSGGAAIALKTAARKPQVFRTLVAHEPPLFGLLNDNPQAQSLLSTVNDRIEAVVDLLQKGENDKAAQLFVETIAFGPGAWQHLPSAVKQTFIYNAPTFLDETKDDKSLQINTTMLSYFDKPALLTNGTQSPPFFAMVLKELMKVLPHAKRITFEDAGHVPHLTHPEQYIKVVKEFCLTND